MFCLATAPSSTRFSSARFASAGFSPQGRPLQSLPPRVLRRHRDAARLLSLFSSIQSLRGTGDGCSIASSAHVWELHRQINRLPDIQPVSSSALRDSLPPMLAAGGRARILSAYKSPQRVPLLAAAPSGKWLRTPVGLGRWSSSATSSQTRSKPA